MEPEDFPADGAKVLFTDMQDIQRRGVYKKDRNGYQELSEVEVSDENQQTYPERDVIRWEYLDKEE